MIGSQKCYEVNKIRMSIIIGSIWEGGDLFQVSGAGRTLEE